MKILRDYQGLVTLIKPPYFWHWKSFFLMALLGGFVYFVLPDEGGKFLIKIVTGILLILSMSWLFRERFLMRGISLSPWITGALISLLILTSFPTDLKYVAWIGFPLFCVCIAAIYQMVTEGIIKEITIPIVRPHFLLFLLIHGLISCWLGLQVLLDQWLINYPSFLAEDLRSSSFIISLTPRSINNSRGIVWLKTMEAYLTRKVRNNSWVEVEAWLLDVYQNRINFGQEVRGVIPLISEDEFWELKNPSMTQGQSLYQLELLVIWRGPTPRKITYLMRKRCEIQKKGTGAEIKCNPLEAKEEVRINRL